MTGKTKFWEAQSGDIAMFKWFGAIAFHARWKRSQILQAAWEDSRAEYLT
ncbi:hypothetical protein KBT16_30310 [Nostoc sp. CCCryo 231-06]|nr:hypothetical protein [Nostoc sp. CCCryo 231-06]